MRKVAIIIASLVFVIITSCATIFSGTTAKVTVTSPNTNWANLKVDGKAYDRMTLPAEVEVKRGSKSSIIEAETDDMEGKVVVEKTFNSVTISNLILWPFWIVDIADGAYMKPKEKTYSILMVRKTSSPNGGSYNEIASGNSQQQPYQQIPQQHMPQQPEQPATNVNQPHAMNLLLADVDINIPQSKTVASDTYVLIIANEEYMFVDKVNYATRDGETFREYCIKTLGVPERQVRYYPNASYGIISGGVDWLKYALNNFEGSKGIVYYCGHGIPDEKTNAAYIIPVDGKGTNMATCINLNNLYKDLAATNALCVTYFMDACFTGANKEGSMLVAARGVACKPKQEKLEGNSVVFSASSGDETAMTYEDKHHGLFTYYLLKKLQQTSGNVSYEELAKYISENVKKDAFMLNEKPQNPVVATSPAASNSWKGMKLK